MPNTYPVGSLPWIERNHALALRAILDAVLDGTYSREDAAEALRSIDTDTVR